jgi:phosphate-selective porin
MRLLLASAVALLSASTLFAQSVPPSPEPPPVVPPGSPVDADPEPPPPGIVLADTERGSITIVNRAQLRYTHEFPDDDVLLVGADNPGESKGSFRIRRAKTEFHGWAWRRNLTYELQLSWAGPEPGASTQTPLEDLVLTWDFNDDGRVRLSGGQFKVPLGRQEMTTSSGLQFADRDILSAEFTRGRDIGLQLDGRVMDGKLEYAAGIFNGNPASRLGNDNQAFQYNARVVLNPFGRVRYSESDFESRRSPRGMLLAVGLSLEHNDLHGAGSRVNDFSTTILAGDVVFKSRGLFLFAEYFARNRDPETGDSYRADGWHAQAGYFLLRDRLEAAGRYARYNASDADDDTVSETGGVVNVYFNRHALKVQTDFRRLANENVDTVNHELRVQAQVMF